MTQVTITGAGSFGIALAILLNRNGHNVTLWGRHSGDMKRLHQNRCHPRYLKGIALPKSINIETDLEMACDAAQTLVMACPTQATRGLAEQLRTPLPNGVPVVSVAKGLELKTGLRNSQVMRDVFGTRRALFVLSGPSHAEEIAKGKPCSVSLAGSRSKTAKRVAALFHSPHFRVYHSSDIVGVEIGGAIKNVIAIAAGLCDGLGLGDNIKAALIARGLVEIKRFGRASGARRTTFDGLSGLGDLVTTCFSPFGRNRAVGEAMGQGKNLEATLKSLGQVAEGVPTAKAVLARAKALGVDMPITSEVTAILSGRRGPAAALERLMKRAPRAE